MSLISICFAVYNNEGSLRELYQRTATSFANAFPDDTAEFIFVNDGSRDNSLEELRKIKNESGDQRIRIVNFSRNFGQMAAILAGWREAKGDAVINLAADLQDPPEQCISMIEEWKKGNQVVISYRKSHQTSMLKKATSRIFYRMMLPSVPPGGFDFALLDKKALKVITGMKERNKFYQYDILWVGFNVKFIPYDKLERKHGKSQYNFVKRFRNFMVAFINTSYMPLRAMTYLGLGFALAGFIYTITIIYAYFMHATPFEGWAPIMVLLLLIGGLIMTMLGILGEYIWRIFDEVKERPPYIIEDEY